MPFLRKDQEKIAGCFFIVGKLSKLEAIKFNLRYSYKYLLIGHSQPTLPIKRSGLMINVNKYQPGEKPMKCHLLLIKEIIFHSNLQNIRICLMLDFHFEKYMCGRELWQKSTIFNQGKGSKKVTNLSTQFVSDPCLSVD